MAESRSVARRNVEQGGVTIDGEKVTDIKFVITKDLLTKGTLLKRGKKIYKKLILK